MQNKPYFSNILKRKDKGIGIRTLESMDNLEQKEHDKFIEDVKISDIDKIDPHENGDEETDLDTDTNRYANKNQN